MKKILAYSLLFTALAACKGEVKKEVTLDKSQEIKASSIEGFSDKSWAILESYFKDSPISQWKFEGEVQKSGDDKKAEFVLPKRLWTIGKLDTPEYTLNMSLPENKVTAKALEGDKVLLTSQMDFSQYVIAPFQFNGEDLDIDLFVDFKASLSGLQDNKEIHDINTKRLLKGDYTAKDFTIDSAYKISNPQAETATDVTYHSTYGQMNAQYVMTPKEDVSDFTYNMSYKDMSENVVQTITDFDYPLVIKSVSKMPKGDMHIDWKNLGNAWFDTEGMSVCFNDLVTFEDEDKVLKGANCFWSLFKDTPLGEMKLTSKADKVEASYNIDFSAFKQDDDYADLFKILKTESVDVGFSGDVDVKMDIEEKDDIIRFSLFEAINNMKFSHNLNIENIKAQAVASGEIENGIVELAHQLIQEFAIKDVAFELGGQVKRSALQSVEDISNEKAWEKFNLGKSNFNFRLYTNTAQGFIDIEALWANDKDVLTLEELSDKAQEPMPTRLTLKIQNFDNMISSIAKVVPEVQMFASMFKGLGKASEEDASVLIFEVTFNENGMPMINGMTLPFM